MSLYTHVLSDQISNRKDRKAATFVTLPKKNKKVPPNRFRSIKFHGIKQPTNDLNHLNLQINSFLRTLIYFESTSGCNTSGIDYICRPHLKGLYRVTLDPNFNVVILGCWH